MADQIFENINLDPLKLSLFPTFNLKKLINLL